MDQEVCIYFLHVCEYFPVSAVARFASEAWLYRSIYTNKIWGDEGGRPANLTSCLRKLDDHPVAQGGYADIWLCEWREVSWGGYKGQRVRLKLSSSLGLRTEILSAISDRWQ
jgi:hypothetical protein